MNAIRTIQICKKHHCHDELYCKSCPRDKWPEQIRAFHDKSTVIELRAMQKRALIQALPQSYQNSNLNDFVCGYAEQKAIVRQLQAYVTNFKYHRRFNHHVIFRGLSGAGKTVLAYLLCKALVERGHRCCDLSYRNFANNPLHAIAEINKLSREGSNYDVVLLDGWLQGELDHNAQKVISSLFNNQIAQAKVIVLTTSITFHQLASVFDESLMQHLIAHNNSNYLISLTWQSLALPNAKYPKPKSGVYLC